MTRNGIVAPLGPFLSLPSTYTSSAVQMLPAWPRLLPRLGDLPSAQPTITVLTRSGHNQQVTQRRMQVPICNARSARRARCIRSEGQRIRGSEETRRIGWLVLLPLVPPFPPIFPVPAAFTSHTHRPNPPSCPTLHPLFLRTISTLSFRTLRSVAERRYVP